MLEKDHVEQSYLVRGIEHRRTLRTLGKVKMPPGSQCQRNAGVPRLRSPATRAAVGAGLWDSRSMLAAHQPWPTPRGVSSMKTKCSTPSVRRWKCRHLRGPAASLVTLLAVTYIVSFRTLSLETDTWKGSCRPLGDPQLRGTGSNRAGILWKLDEEVSMHDWGPAPFSLPWPKYSCPKRGALKAPKLNFKPHEKQWTGKLSRGSVGHLQHMFSSVGSPGPCLGRLLIWKDSVVSDIQHAAWFIQFPGVRFSEETHAKSS